VDRRERGRWAEQAVAEALAQRGFEILGRNVRMQRGELDLVARRHGILWFVETKSRGRRDRGAPFRAIDARKKRSLFAAAREYVLLRRFRGDYGFLAASVLPGPGDGRPCVQLLRLPITPPEGPPEAT
jgi:Holliday junction resolvase-like predicted endonuclease